MDALDLPTGEAIEFRQILHESGVQLLRLKVLDGARYTTLDLDLVTVDRLAAVLTAWSDAVRDSSAKPPPD